MGTAAWIGLVILVIWAISTCHRMIAARKNQFNSAMFAVSLTDALNRMFAAQHEVDNAWSQVDVQLKRRHDLIPNLVQVVKDAMGYEQEALKAVIEARNTALSATGPAEIAQAENALTITTGKLLALTEAHPSLKANSNIASLQEELAATETKISFARQFYNDSVMAFNNDLQMLPDAREFDLLPREYFDVPETEKALPQISRR